MKAEPFDRQARLEGRFDQIDRLAPDGAELRRQFDDRAGVGHANPQHQAGVRCVLLQLPNLGVIVVRHQRLVGIQLDERFDRP